jgi:hypothetical protein
LPFKFTAVHFYCLAYGVMINSTANCPNFAVEVCY